jgi:hypothetical protein
VFLMCAPACVSFEPECRFWTSGSSQSHTSPAKQVARAADAVTAVTLYPRDILSRVTGLDSAITNTATYPVSGIRITFDGFYDKMHVLVAAFASVLSHLHVKQVSQVITSAMTLPETVREGGTRFCSGDFQSCLPEKEVRRTVRWRRAVPPVALPAL